MIYLDKNKLEIEKGTGTEETQNKEQLRCAILKYITLLKKGRFKNDKKGIFKKEKRKKSRKEAACTFRQIIKDYMGGSNFSTN